MRMDGAPKNLRLRNPPRERLAAEHELIDEITTVARRIAAVRDSYGQPIFRTDAAWRVLATVSSSPYCLAIADLARALGVTRQAAHELAYEAARANVVELVPNHQDKRILQLLLTPHGRSELRAARIAQNLWLAMLLGRYAPREMAAATKVIRGLRRQLERDAKVMTTKGDSS